VLWVRLAFLLLLAFISDWFSHRFGAVLEEFEVHDALMAVSAARGNNIGQ
jgi:F0F1-type ATP synthase membrane subunit b/b'